MSHITRWPIPFFPWVMVASICYCALRETAKITHPPYSSITCVFDKRENKTIVSHYLDGDCSNDDEQYHFSIRSSGCQSWPRPWRANKLENWFTTPETPKTWSGAIFMRTNFPEENLIVPNTGHGKDDLWLTWKRKFDFSSREMITARQKIHDTVQFQATYPYDFVLQISMCHVHSEKVYFRLNTMARANSI